MDLYRVGVKFAFIFTVAQHRSELQNMLAAKMKRVRDPIFHPTEAGGSAILLAEVIALISQGREQHFRRALRVDCASHAGVGNRTLENAASERLTVKNRGSGFVEICIRCYRLRIKEVETGVALRMR